MKRIAHRCTCHVRTRGTSMKHKCNRYGRAVKIYGLIGEMFQSMCAAHRRREGKDFRIEVVKY